MIKLLRLKYIKDDTKDKIIKVEDQSIQKSKSLKYLIKKLKFDK